MNVDNERIKKQLELLRQWLQNKIYGKELSDLLLPGEKVAIYGAHWLGELLYDELLYGKKANVVCFIDRNADSIGYGIDDIPIYSLAEIDETQEVDSVIVAAYEYYDEICKNVREKMGDAIKCYSLREMVYRTE